ncbi:sulfite oxidase [Gracilaria domingensis]|nr:sulfite oxidase [Gracilaria domingensis]
MQHVCIRDERREAAAPTTGTHPGGGAGRGGRAQFEVRGHGGAGGGREPVTIAAQGLWLCRRRGRDGRGGQHRGAEHPEDAGDVGLLLARGGRGPAARGVYAFSGYSKAIVRAESGAAQHGTARRVRLDTVARGGRAG